MFSCFRSISGYDANAPAGAVADSRLPAVAGMMFVLVSVAWSGHADTVRFAAIGDYGRARQAEADVAALVSSWNPDFVITLGDNNYPDGLAEDIDANIGQYYSSYIHPYVGSYGAGADTNRFFPSLGNHDMICAECPAPYTDYFTLPGNERYYDFTWGPVHLFAVSSDEDEPGGTVVGSPQAEWLRTKLDSSTAPFRLVYFHHPPYSSGYHGGDDRLAWPFRQWGADAVLNGHEHSYERLEVDSVVYVINGLGGTGFRTFADTAILVESKIHYTGDYGAMLVTVTLDSANFRFITRAGEVIDDFTIGTRHAGQEQVAAVDDLAPRGAPVRFGLHQNYPNPFNPGTTLGFDLPEAADLSLVIYDLMGREIVRLVEGHLEAGYQQVNWNGQTAKGQGVTAGIYIARLVAPNYTQSIKMVLLK